VAKDGEEIEGQATESPLAEGHRDRLWEPRKDATVEQAVEEIGGAHHGSGPMVS